MGTRTFSANLSVSSLNKLKQDLLNYRDSILPSRLDEFVRELAEAGIPVIEKNIAGAGFTYDEKGIQSGSNTEHNTYVKVDSLIEMSRATLVLEGRDILFIEFGAGVYHSENGVNGSDHPKGAENGFLIGTYGMGHGSQQVWGYYADSGELVLTHGTKATMPMYKASLEIQKKVIEIARKVFSK